MLIEFAKNCGLSAQDRKLVSSWPSLHQRLQTSEAHSSFSTSRVIIRGAVIIGKEDKRSIIMVDVRLFFTIKGEKDEQSYHLSILPNSSTLLLVFHDLGDNLTNSPDATAQNLYLVVVKQARWAADTINSPEPPFGQSEKNESPRSTAWREAREEIGEELFDQLCRNYTPKLLTELDAISFYQIIAPDTMISGLQEAFTCIVPVTSDQLNEIREMIKQNSIGGLAEEGEKIFVTLMPLEQVLDESKIGIISHIILEFMRSFGIAIPSKNQRLPFPSLKTMG